jgi:uncharacterized phage protein (TIGR02218 family)
VKTIPAALQTHYDTGGTSVAHAIVIQREDGLLVGFTSHDQPFEMDIAAWFDPSGISSSSDGAANVLTFDAQQGLDASAIVTTAGFNVDNLELTTLDDGTLFDRDEVLAGVWRNAEFRIFRYRWDVSPPTIDNDVETLIRGWFGEVTLNQNTIKVELRGLTQKLQQPIGIVSTKNCRARLGDANCTKDLTSFTTTLTVTGVTSKQAFAASAATATDDFYGEGIITWLTGNNAGVSQKVRTYAGSTKTFTLVLPMVLTVQNGDTFTAIAGCRKRLADCRDKFNNVLNFQGEPHRPTLDDLVKPA